MTLNERKLKILEAIVNDYVSSAEPVGSRTIARKYDWGLSSATIRNEMSDLEELGLITQPHASAGRIPSDSGYRLYVDSMMKRRALTFEEEELLKEVVYKNIGRIDDLMRETARAIAYLTSYTTVVSEPIAKSDVIKHLQLIEVDEGTVLLVVVGASRVYQNQLLAVPNAPGAEELAKLSVILNDKLRDKDPNALSGGEFAEIAAAFGESAHILRPALDGINAAFVGEGASRYYTGGVNNLLAFPEFSDLGRARGLVKAMEERRALITALFSDSADTPDSGGFGNIKNAKRVIIGSENGLDDMRDCAVITAAYGDGQSGGKIGVIGPTRMNYSQVLSILDGIVEKINKVIKGAGG